MLQTINGFSETLSKICKVPYDASIVKNGMNPNNHRLRSLSHDPFFGLFFSVFDIALGTTTYIDNTGHLNIYKAPNNPISIPKKFVATLYYIGHIVSDLFTARGIPIPGFFLTQFFTVGVNDDSIAELAENMYKDGYDMRHLASMSIPVLAKNIIISAYLYLFEMSSNEIVMTGPMKEKKKIEASLKKEKMYFIANCIAVGGNTIKFFAPPSSCNPCSLNAPEWFAFLHSSIAMIKAKCRDFTAEEVMYNREDITLKWDALFQEENISKQSGFDQKSV